MSKLSLTALVHTKNSASTLEKCLESLRFADTIILVDMHSDDDTLKIARRYTKNIFEFEDVGFVEPARNFGLSKVATDWVVIVDADEEVSEDLAGVLSEIVTGRYGLAADAYYLPRRNVIFEHAFEHTGWWPDYQLRLFKKGVVTWSDNIHAVPQIKGKSEKLPAQEKGALIHHNYQTIEQYLDRLNRYTSITAQQQQATTLTSEEVWQSFSGQFLARFFAQQGYRDGVHGLSLSLLQSMYQLVTQLKRWQAQGFPKADITSQTMAAIRKSQREFNYWLADYQVQQSSGLSRLYWQIRRKLKV
ncbi:MAG TPA: glycosyltransferase family 2 protein [Vitreimonas sp.]|nr:glycosyltransferase family 2 protein [Vitreimonas sp.]